MPDLEEGRVIGLLLACAAPSAPSRADALRVDLAGAWTEGPRAVSLPWPQAGGSFSVARVVELPEGWSGPAVLHAEATGWRVTAWVDGREVGHDVGGVRPIEVDLGEWTGGRHELRLRVDAPTAQNVVDGVVVDGLAAFTGEEPREGRAMAAGAVWLELGAVPSVSARLDGDDLVARAQVAAGERVRFRVVRDGDALATLPDATAGDDGVAESRAPWTGPRWTPEDPALAWLVAELPDGRLGQVRFGAREVTLDGDRLRVGGEPAYLAVQRFTRHAGELREELGRFTAVLDAFGANGLELHASGLTAGTLAAADELGLYAVVTPICDGRRKGAGAVQPFAAWRAHVEEGHRRLASLFSGHPSLVLWNVEADPTPDLAAVFRATGLPALDLSRTEGLPHDAPPREGRPYAAYLNELPWRYVEGATDRLDGILAAHRDAGVGLALPDFSPVNGTSLESSPSARAWAARVKPLLASHHVAAWPAGARRGVASVEVSVTRAGRRVEGVVVVLEAPGHAPVAAASDAQGLARLDLDYAGPATISAWGASATQAVPLSPGTWTVGEWRAGVSRATLALP